MAKANSNQFNRILTLLRKEKGLTQKEAAASLGISQALLSHYEKGIRECGLDFVVRVADFYGVSCDYLLGRSPDRSGLTLSVDNIPDSVNSAEDSKYRGTLLPVLSKKLLINSISVLYELLQKNPTRELVLNVTSYLNAAVYKMFRMIYTSSPKNQESLFELPSSQYKALTHASMTISEMEAGEQLQLMTQQKDSEAFTSSSEKLSKDYPQQATSLFNLIQQVEARAKIEPKE